GLAGAGGGGAARASPRGRARAVRHGGAGAPRDRSPDHRGLAEPGVRIAPPDHHARVDRSAAAAGSAVHYRAWAALRGLKTDHTRFLSWWSHPRLSVPALEPPPTAPPRGTSPRWTSSSTTSWRPPRG